MKTYWQTNLWPWLKEKKNPGSWAMDRWMEGLSLASERMTLMQEKERHSAVPRKNMEEEIVWNRWEELAGIVFPFFFQQPAL